MAAPTTLLKAPRPDKSGAPAGLPVPGQLEVGVPGSEQQMEKDPFSMSDIAEGRTPTEAPKLFSLLAGGDGYDDPADDEGGGLDLGPSYSMESSGVDEVGVQQAVDELLKSDPITVRSDSLIFRDDNDVRQLFEDRLREAAQFRKPYETRWLRSYADYHQVLENDAARWRVRVAIPYTYSQVNTWVPLCTSAVFDSGSYIWEVISMSGQKEEKARALTTYLEYAARVKASLPRKIRDGFWFSGLFGIGVWRTGWRFEEDFVRDTEAVEIPDGEGGSYHLGNRQVERVVTTHDHPDVTCVDPMNFFPCPQASEADLDIPWVIERIEVSEDRLKRWADAEKYGADGKNRILAYLQERKDGKHPPIENDSLLGDVANRVQMYQKAGLPSPYGSGSNREKGREIDSARSPIILWEMWTREYVVLIANDGEKSVLAKAPNPFAHRSVPYVTHSYDRNPGQIYGRGIGDVVSPIQRLVNFIYNHAAETAMLRRNAPMLMKKGSTDALRSGQLELRPGVVITLKDPKDLVRLDIPEVMRETLLQEQHLLVHADKATGLNDLLRGFDSGGGGTATEASLLTSLTRQRQTAHVKEIRETMALLGRHWVSLCKQFLSTEQMIHVAGEDGMTWTTVDPKDILGEWDVVPSASFSRSNPGQLRNDLLALLPVVESPMFAPFIKPGKLLQRVLQGFELERPAELMTTPPPAPMDPTIEAIALADGADFIRPSPTENFVQHLAQHQADLAELKAEPVKNYEAIEATQSHINDTMLMMAELGASQAAFGGPGASPPAAAPAGGGRPQASRQKPGQGGGDFGPGATRLGKAQGAYGPPGRSPGPAGAPRRRVA